MEQKSSTKNLLWLIVVLFGTSSLLAGIRGGSPLLGLSFLIATICRFAFAFIHGSRRYGIRRMLIFFGITFVVSWSYETASILTGFPFGDYYYNFGPKLWLVPWMIMPAYFSVCYMSWSIAKILLDKFNNIYNRLNVFLVPLVASFIMVMWDLSFDPNRATINHGWVWENGGAYFGVPFINFMGWFLCVYTIFQLFALYIKASNKRYKSDSIEILDRGYLLQPVLMYVVIILEFAATAITAQNEVITDLNGHEWWTSDIYISLLLVSLFTMFFVSLLSIVHLYTSEKIKIGSTHH